MILLDSNVLIYAVGREHPLKPIAADALTFAALGHMRVTPRVLEEFAHVHSRGGRAKADSVALVGDWAATLGPVEFASEEDVASAFDLWALHPVDVADALLAAQAMRLDALLLSADRAFGDIPGLRFLDLSDPDLADKIPN